MHERKAELLTIRILVVRTEWQTENDHFFFYRGHWFAPRRSDVTAPNVLHLNWRTQMPLVNVKLIEGVFTPAQKQEMIRKLTDTMVSIEGESMRPVTWVVVEEVKSGDWGIGGKPLTTSDVKALAAGKG